MQVQFVLCRSLNQKPRRGIQTLGPRAPDRRCSLEAVPTMGALQESALAQGHMSIYILCLPRDNAVGFLSVFWPTL